MNKVIFAFFLIIMPSFLFAQSSDTVYFDKKWNPVSSSKYKYYRICNYIDTLVQITDYYKNGKVQMTGAVKKTPHCNCSNIDEQNRVGLHKYYNKKGVITNLRVYDLLNHSQFISDIYPDSLALHLDKDLKRSFDVSYDKNGLITWCGYLIDNCNRHERWVFYEKNKRISAIVNYYYGVLHGKCLYYYESGNLLCEANFNYGVLHGKYLDYYKSGNLFYEANYNNGKRQSRRFK